MKKDLLIISACLSIAVTFLTVLFAVSAKAQIIEEEFYQNTPPNFNTQTFTTGNRYLFFNPDSVEGQTLSTLAIRLASGGSSIDLNSPYICEVPNTGKFTDPTFTLDSGDYSTYCTALTTEGTNDSQGLYGTPPGVFEYLELDTPYPFRSDMTGYIPFILLNKSNYMGYYGTQDSETIDSDGMGGWNNYPISGTQPAQLFGGPGGVEVDLVLFGPGPSVTQLDIVYPTYATTTPTTTFDIEVNYTIGDDISAYSIGGQVPEQFGLSVLFQNTLTGAQTSLGIDYTISQTPGPHTYIESVTLPQGNYSILVELVGDYGFLPPPTGCTPYPPFTTCEGAQSVSNIASDTVGVFSVDNGYFDHIGFDYGVPGSQFGLATTTCSVTQIGGCFQNALAFLFFPDPDILSTFNFMWENIKKKPPFGYLTQTISAFSGVSASTTPAFTWPEIPFMSAIFTPIREGISGLLWLIFGVAFIFRLSKIEI